MAAERGATAALNGAGDHDGTGLAQRRNDHAGTADTAAAADDVPLDAAVEVAAAVADVDAVALASALDDAAALHDQRAVAGKADAALRVAAGDGDGIAQLHVGAAVDRKRIRQANMVEGNGSVAQAKAADGGNLPVHGGNAHGGRSAERLLPVGREIAGDENDVAILGGAQQLMQRLKGVGGAERLRAGARHAEQQYNRSQGQCPQAFEHREETPFE